MEGPSPDDLQLKGIMPRMMDMIFHDIEKYASGKIEFTISVSFLEIYNEKIKDLLDS